MLVCPCVAPPGQPYKRTLMTSRRTSFQDLMAIQCPCLRSTWLSLNTTQFKESTDKECAMVSCVPTCWTLILPTAQDQETEDESQDRTSVAPKSQCAAEQTACTDTAKTLKAYKLCMCITPYVYTWTHVQKWSLTSGKKVVNVLDPSVTQTTVSHL